MAAARSSEVVIGKSLGNYRVVSLLGRGGMGAVYEGEHAVLGRKAAVKVMLPEYSHNSDLVDRFFQEARATARLRHHAFVEVFDSGTLPDGSAYLVMELLEGESLGAHLVRRGALPLGEALTIARHIAEGVGHAHRNGIVHRDLKPDNVFLARGFDPERPGRIGIKILDFGIAKLSGLESGAGSRTRTGTLMGTPLFMAPEQCRGAGRVVIDHRADIYALGCILHAMLTAQPPFPYEGVGEIIAAHIGQAPPALGTLVRGVPQQVEALVLRMLAKNVDARPSSMDEVIRELLRMATLPGVKPVDLADIPVAASGATHGVDSMRPAVETDVPIVEDAGSVSGPRLETRPMPVSLPPYEPPFQAPPHAPFQQSTRPPSHPPVVGGTKWLQPKPHKSISTLSEATGAHSIVTMETRRPGKGRGVALALAAVAVVAGGFIVFRSQLWEPVRPLRPTSATPASPGTAELGADDRRPRDIAPPPAEDPSPAPPARAHVTPPEPPSAVVAREVRIRITSTPSGAEIIDTATGARVGQTPYVTSAPAERRTARYTVQKPDFKSRDVAVKFDADASVDVVLRRKSSSSGPSAPAGGRHSPAVDEGDDERRKL
jgi:serine/threonine-protein kinase